MEKENSDLGVEKKELLYSGKAKDVFLTEDPSLAIQCFRNDATAFNGQKHELFEGKGKLCNKISSLIFNYLEDSAIETHFVKRLSDTEMLIKKLKMIPVEVVVRNYAAGSLAKRLGLKEGTRLTRTIIEYYYKNDELGDPLINEHHIQILELTEYNRLLMMKNKAYLINKYLQMMFGRVDISLIDFKLEFGIINGNEHTWSSIILGDEISPDTCRLWEMDTNRKLDKDNFRFDLGDIRRTYSDIYCRLIADPKNREFHSE